MTAGDPAPDWMTCNRRPPRSTNRPTTGGAADGCSRADICAVTANASAAAIEHRRQFDEPQRLICVFQPHQHSRTRFLLEDFAASFAAADLTIVPDIYFVRDSESERQKVSSADLVERPG